MRWIRFRRWLAALVAPEGDTEVRPFDDGGELIDEVVGWGFLHVECMDENLYWARLDTPNGKDVVMWFNAKGKRLELTAEYDKPHHPPRNSRARLS